jgi:hypothetical protein
MRGASVISAITFPTPANLAPPPAGGQPRMWIRGFARGGAYWTNIDGSFYDFQLDLIHGTNRERLSGRDAGDDWGPRALQAWVEQLRVSNRFDPQADDIIRSAALIEEVYRA